MNSLPVVYDRSVASSARLDERELIVSTSEIGDARAAANEAAEADSYTRRDPLWIMPIGLACFLAVAAAVIALG